MLNRHTTSKTTLKPRIEKLELRQMLASDLAWDPGQTFLLPQGNESVELSLHQQKLVIGTKSSAALALPDDLAFVRDIAPNVKEYQTNSPITTDLLASVRGLSDVAFTTPVFVNAQSDNESVLLNEIVIAIRPTQTAENFFAQHTEFSAYRPLDGTHDQFIATVKDGYGATALDAGIKVSRDEGAAWVSPNFYQVREKYYTPNDPRYPNQWHLNNFGQSGGLSDADSDLPEAWDVNQGGSSNIVIGIIDDGIDSTHPDLNVWTNPGETNFDGIDNDGNGWIDDIRGWNFVTDTNQTEPVGADKHGTAVAGVAAARGDNGIGVAGAAYKSKVMSIKIFDDGFVASDASIASAIYYAGGRTRDGLGTWKSADIVNSSWGGGDSSALINAALTWGTTQGREGVGAAYFFASGNDSASSFTGPAAESLNIPGVVAVGATTNYGLRSTYSNYGSALDLVAPSNDNKAGTLPIDTTDRVGSDGFATGDYTGIGSTGFGQTSSASALAAGIGALVLAQANAQGVVLSPADLRSLLRSSTELIGGASYDVATGKNEEYGFGRINAATAVIGVNRPEISVANSTSEIANRGNVGFASAPVGLFSELVLRIRNQGTQTLNIGNLDVTGPFAVQDIGSKSLQIGQSTTLTLRFLPTANGSFLGKVIINSNDADEAAFELNLFGSVAQTSIAGTVYEDFDGDSAFDTFERFLELPTDVAYIDANNNSTRDAGETSVPIANGGFAFEGLAAGTYTVRTDIPGWTVTQPGKNGYVVTLTGASDSKTGINFGFSKNDRLYSNVYEEINQDGIQNPGEPPLPNFAVSGTHAYAQSNATALPIPARGAVSSIINVPDAGTVVSLVVLVNITHPFVSDLTLTLTAPDGTTVLLAQGVGGGGDNFTTTRFGDAGATSITTGTAPFTGTFRPQQALSLFNGINIQGTWSLTINDVKDFDAGQLVNWSLEFQRRFVGVSDKNGWALVDLPTGTNTVGVELQPNWLYSRPATGNYSIVSSGAPVYDRPFGLFYDNVAPTDIFLSNNVIPENQPIGMLVGLLSSIDPNRFGNTFTYTLVAGTRPNDNSQFNIVGNTLQVNALFNFELKDSYLVRIRTTDAGGKFFEKEFTISVTDANDTPSALSLTPQSVDENKPAGTLIGTFATTDEDAGDTFTYSLVTGTGSTDNSSFAVVGDTLVTAASFNFEAKDAYSVRVRTTDAGGKFFEQVLTVTINDVPDVGASIAGSVFEDYNGNGVFDAFERLVQTTTAFAYIDSNDNGIWEAAEKRASVINGAYLIDGLAAGTFVVRTEASGYTATFPVKNRHLVTQATDTSAVTGIQFGRSKNDRMYSFVYEEINQDGTVNAGEPGLAGFTLSGINSVTATNSTVTPIPARGAINSTINVTDSGTIAGLAVVVNIDHTWDSDLTLTLTAPNGRTITLAQNVGADGDNFTNTRFDDTGANLISAGTAPFTGTFRPLQPLSVLNGADLAGTWTLSVDDSKDFDSGVLNNWSLLFQRKYSAVSDANGWALMDLPSGTNTIGVELQPNWLFSNPGTGAYTVTSAGAPVYNRPYGLFLDNVAPTDLLLSNAFVNENLPTGTVVGTLTSVDPNRTGNTFTYTLVTGANPNNNAQFQIVGNVLQTNAVFNFEVKNSYLVRIRTTDAGGKFFEKEFTITVRNLNDNPTALTLTPLVVAENLPAATVVGTFITIDQDAGDTHTYSLVAGAGSTNNASFSISGNKLATNASFDFETQSSYSIRVRTQDQAGGLLEQVFTVRVQNANESSTIISLSNTAIEENSGAGVVIGQFTNNDPDVGDTFTYALVAGTGSSGNSSFFVSGNRLFAATNFDFETQSIYPIRVRVTDRAGLIFETNLTIRIRNVNEGASTILLSNNKIVENEASGTLVGVLSTDDPDAFDINRLQFVSGTGSDDNLLFSIVGNELRTAVTFDFEARSTYSVRIRATDQLGLFIENAFVLDVTNVNDAPGNILLSATELFENAPVPTLIGSFTVADQDLGDSHTLTLVSGAGDNDNAKFQIVAGQLQSNQILDFESQRLYSIRVRATDTPGLFVEKQFNISVRNRNEAPSSIELRPSEVDEGLAVGTTVGLLSTIDVDAGDKHQYELINNAAFPDNQKFLIVGDELRTGAVFNFDVKSSYSIQVRSSDEGGLFVEKTLVISVKNVNAPPTDIGLLNRSVQENKPVGTVVGTFSTTDPDGTDSFTYQLFAGAGSTNNSSFTIVGNQLLTNAIFDFETKTNYSIRVQSRDSAGVTTDKVFSIDVTNANESPTGLNLTPSTIAENSPSGTLVGALLAQDPDAGDTFAYSLVPGVGSTDNALFTIANGALRTNAVFDFEVKPAYSVRVRSTDAGGLSSESVLNVSVTNVNETPFNLNLNGVLAENTPPNEVLLVALASDPDVGDSLTYSLVTGLGSDDNAKFAITASGGVRTIGPVDFETQPSYLIRLRATDTGGLFVERTFTVIVENRNDAPSSIAITPSSLSENAGANQLVGTVSTVDQDGPGIFTYSFATGTGDSDNASFVLVGDELRAIASFDYEAKNAYSIRLRSTDAAGLSVEEVLSISVVDANESPSSLRLTNATIPENSAADSLVGLLSTIDVDAGDTFTYTLVNGDGAADNSSFKIVGNQLLATIPFDFEAKSSYSVRIRSTDRGGLFLETSQIIAVTDVNDLPTNVQLSSSSLSENLPSSTLVGLLSGTDPDAEDSLIFRLVSGNNDNAKFTISGNQLLSAETFNFETKSSYRVEVQALDKSASGPIQTFVISINDANEPITDINLSSFTIDENTAAGSLVGRLTAVDPDLSDSYTFSLVDGAGSGDNSKLTIVGDELRIVDSPNFELQSSYAIRIRGADRLGLSFIKNFVVSVRDVPEAPSALALSNSRISENLAASTIVGALSATDSDLGDAITLSLVSGTGATNNDQFQILNGNLVARNSFDFEKTPSFSVRVRAIDSTQLFTESVFVITVDNVNEAPTNITAPNKSVAENQSAGTVVSVLSTTDSDLGETYTYTLAPNATTGDNASFQIVGNELRTNRRLNFEAQNSYQLRIRSTDSTGLFVEIPFTVTVTDVSETAPVAVADTGTTTTNQVVVIDVLANDRDTDGSIDRSTVVIATAPSSGTARVLADGRIEFTPPTGERLTSTFSYTFKDNDSNVSNAASVSIKIYAAYQNQLNALDVDADGAITPLDVLTLVNDINRNGLRDLPTGTPSSAPYLDVNGNGKLDPLDVLEIVNAINAKSGANGEGESVAAIHIDNAFASPHYETLISKQATQFAESSAMQYVDEYYQNLGRKRIRS